MERDRHSAQVGSTTRSVSETVKDSGRVRHRTLTEEPTYNENDIIRHALLRTEFTTWFQEASGRFARPVSPILDSPARTKLHVPGLHPALEIILDGDTGINVYATWNDVFWDIVACMDFYTKQAPDGTWRDPDLLPEYQRVFPSREAIAREIGFEPLLKWFNNRLVSATHLALYGEEPYGKNWTSAHLISDGRDLNTGKPISAEDLRHLLPVFTTSG